MLSYRIEFFLLLQGVCGRLQHTSSVYTNIKKITIHSPTGSPFYRPFQKVVPAGLQGWCYSLLLRNSGTDPPAQLFPFLSGQNPVVTCPTTEYGVTKILLMSTHDLKFSQSLPVSFVFLDQSSRSLTCQSHRDTGYLSGREIGSWKSGREDQNSSSVKPATLIHS
jgi:hypothetical protein